MEIEDLKDQITNQAANFMLSENIDCDEIFDKKIRGQSHKKAAETKTGGASKQHESIS